MYLSAKHWLTEACRKRSALTSQLFSLINSPTLMLLENLQEIMAVKIFNSLLGIEHLTVFSRIDKFLKLKTKFIARDLNPFGWFE